MGILRVLQRSLFLQVIAILVGLLIAIFAVLQILIQTTLIFTMAPKVLENHARTTAGLVEMLESTPPETESLVLATFSTPGRTARIANSFPDGALLSDVFISPFEKEFADRDLQPARHDVRYRILRRFQLDEAQSGAAAPVRFTLFALEVSVQMPDGRVLTTFMSPSAIFEMSDLWQVLFIPLVFAGAVIIALRQGFGPLRALESAAHSLGRTTKPIHVDAKGTEDIRRVARALNKMQVRVQTLLADRSRMVAALAHDIRTILTQLKLRLDEVEGVRAAQLEADIDLMEHLVSDMLLYARSEHPTTQPELIDLNKFLADFAANLTQPVPVDVDDEQFWIVAEGAALTRALTNLCKNATSYAGAFTIEVERGQQGISVHVLDRGPGIAEADLENIFDPFFRGERSRNRETGGTGLGLSIARSLLSAQGARLTVVNRDGGGVRASISFPNATRIS